MILLCAMTMLSIIVVLFGLGYEIIHGIVGDENPGIHVFGSPDEMIVDVKQIYRINEKNFNVLVRILIIEGLETKMCRYSYRNIDNNWMYYTVQKNWLPIKTS